MHLYTVFGEFVVSWWWAAGAILFVAATIGYANLVERRRDRRRGGPGFRA